MKVLIVAVVLSVFAAAAVAQHYTLGTDDEALRQQFATAGEFEHNYGGFYANDGSDRYRKSTYEHGGYDKEVHAGPAKAYSYPSPAPKVKCPEQLLLSCQPYVAHVPCVAPPSHGYGKY